MAGLLDEQIIERRFRQPNRIDLRRESVYEFSQKLRARVLLNTNLSIRKMRGRGVACFNLFSQSLGISSSNGDDISSQFPSQISWLARRNNLSLIQKGNSVAKFGLFHQVR